MRNCGIFENIAVGTNIAMGYPLEEALAMLSDCGVEYVELSSIAGMCEHIEPAAINEDYAEYVGRLLGKNKLKCRAVSGHVDLTLEGQLQDFLRKIKFTALIGAEYINTNSGPLSRLDIFRKNMSRVISEAERYNVTVCLESHGDIIGTARDSVRYIQELNHPLIKMNYDTGNTYFHSRGRCRVVEDIGYSEPCIAYMHIKDVSIEGDKIFYRPIGQGDLDFTEIFKKVKDMRKTIPASLEIPVFVRGTLDGIGPRDTPLPPDRLRDAIESSFSFMERTLEGL